MQSCNYTITDIAMEASYAYIVVACHNLSFPGLQNEPKGCVANHALACNNRCQYTEIIFTSV